MYQPVTRSPMEPFGRIQGRPSPDQSYRLYATAFKALVDWPQGFYEFLHAYTCRNGERTTNDVIASLGRLYSRWLNGQWKHPAFSFVQNALSHYLVDSYATPSAQPENRRYISKPPQAPTFVSPIRAAQLLEVSSWTIKRLIKAGFLTSHTVKQGKSRRYGFVQQDEALTLRLAWAKALSLEDATKWLGLTRSIVVDLVRVGLLVAEHSSNADGSEQWMFSKQNLDRCYCEVIKNVKTHRSVHSHLAETARALSTIGIRVADIFKLVADRKLHCWSDMESPALAKLSFEYSEIRAILESPERGRELLNSEKTAHQLGVEPWTLSRWANAGLLSPKLEYDYETYFDPSTIDDFLANHMFSKEAAEILDVEIEELEMWPREWGLKAIKGTGTNGRSLYLFRREDVKRLKSNSPASG